MQYPAGLSQLWAMAQIDIQKIHFHYIDVRFSFENRTKLKFFLLERLRKEGFVADAINYIFCTDAYLLEMNQAYLQHDTYTDIITFALSAKGEPLVSDIYISVERVQENAAIFKTTFKQELHRVIFHGLLHLIGYGDKNKAQAGQMRVKENEYLKLYFRST